MTQHDHNNSEQKTLFWRFVPTLAERQIVSRRVYHRIPCNYCQHILKDITVVLLLYFIFRRNIFKFLYILYLYII